ncbi:MAG: uroporphyrinogen decarboxylase family protein [Planctomycetota bacterium]
MEGHPQRRRSRAQILEEQVRHARAHRLPDDRPQGVGPRLPPASPRARPRAARRQGHRRGAQGEPRERALDPLRQHVHLVRIADNYADKLAFVGGLDARIIETDDRGLIKREVTTLVEGMKDRGARYVFGSDHSISTNVDYEDFRYMLEVYHECKMY